MKKILFLFLLLFVPHAVLAKNTSVVVMDIDSGRVLYAENENQEKLIASTTKVMTI